MLVQQHIDLSGPGELGSAAKATQAGVEAGHQLADALVDGAGLLGSSERLGGGLQGGGGWWWGGGARGGASRQGRVV